MLEKLSLRNFKACRELDLDIGPLTVVAGLNSSGKSSVLQSLGLLRQSYDRQPLIGLTLNGDWACLGTGSDVISEDAQTDEITIEVKEDSTLYKWQLKAAPDAYVLPFSVSPNNGPAFVQSQPFQYLQADRITPATMYP